MAQKWAVLAVLLFLPINLAEVHWVSVKAGHEAVLRCPKTSEASLTMVIWRSNSSSCYRLSYRKDTDKTDRENCSERITWKYSPASDPALRIYPVNLGDEGNYTCEIANREGNFHSFSSLTVIVPPTVTLTHDKSRVAVCQASAGKPPADIFWIPASNHSSEEEFHHPNGTVTRVSYFGWLNSSFPSVTCLVTHPAMNQTLGMDLRDPSHDFSRRLYILIGGVAAGVSAATGLILCLIFKCKSESFDEPEIYYNPIADYVQLAGCVNRYVAQQNTLQLEPGHSHFHVQEENQPSLLTFQRESMRITTQELFMYAYNSVGTSSQLSY